jgi:hypothetical protein
MKTKRNIFFILGNPRSGTSLLRRILDEHPSVSIPPESNFLIGLYPQYRDYTLTNKDKEKLLEDLFRFPKFGDLKVDRYALETQVFDRSIVYFEDVYMAIQRQYALQRGKVDNGSIFFFGEKNRFWRDKAEWISSCFPDAIVLHIIRDPRDIAVSYAQLNRQQLDVPDYPKLEENPIMIINEWILNNNRIKEMQKNHRYFMVRYEDLILNTRNTINKLLDILGLDIDDSIFEYYKKEIFGVTEPMSHQLWKAKLTEAPDKNNIGKFEAFLSPVELGTIHTLFHKNLADYGYRC